MTNPFGRVALGVVAAALAATSLSASPQDQNTNQPPPPFMGPGGGPGRFPQGGWFGGAMGPGGPLGMLRMFSQQLQLTDAERDQLKAIAQSHHDEWQALADRARAAHQALAAAVTADTIDAGEKRRRCGGRGGHGGGRRARVLGGAADSDRRPEGEAEGAAGPGQRTPIVTSRTAVTMCAAEIPNRSSSSSGLPLRAISRTARRCTVKPEPATASATASPNPPAA